MRRILCSMVLVAGCDPVEAEADRNRQTEYWVWESTPAPEPGYVCYRYVILNGAINEATHIVCFDKSKAHEKPEAAPLKNCECN